MKAKMIIPVTRARVTVICGGAFSCLQPLKTLSGEEIARLKRRLKNGPRLTKKGRAEYLRWLVTKAENAGGPKMIADPKKEKRQ